MTVRNTVSAQPLVSFNAAALTANFQAMNVGGFSAPCFLVRIINASNRNVTISYDGVTAHDYILIDEVLQLPMQSNAAPTNWVALLKEGTVIYIKSTVAGAGAIYLSAYYQPSL